MNTAGLQSDVAVVGGGVAGAATAQLLSAGGLKVVLIEAAQRCGWRIGETLPPEALPVLQSLGVWSTFVQAGHLPCYGNATTWGSAVPQEKDFIFNPYGHAWQLDRAVFEEMLLTAATEAGVQVLRGQTVQEITRVDGRWRLSTGTTTLSSDWLIDATGRGSSVARALGQRRQVLDQLVAVYCVATSSTGTDQDSRTWIESCADGWWYTALTPGGRRTVSFQTDADLLPGQEWRDPAWFAARLQDTRHLSALLDRHGYEIKEPPRLTSAHSSRLASFGGDGWVAVGDAAMSFDPLSGQGLLKALRSAQSAALVVLGNTDDLDPAARSQIYTQTAETEWQQYLGTRLRYYAFEQRWNSSPFWQRRMMSTAQP